MLTKYQSNRLENIQKKCLRSIYGFDLDYEQLLQIAELQTLEERRELAQRKFALKASKNPQFAHWFPLNKNRTSVRNPKMYEEQHASSDRLYNSPLFKMRRILNDTPSQERFNTPNYIDLSHLFNEP